MAKISAVSVVIPTYNQHALLSETLESVFAQTFHDFEVVVIDDGSTDDTPKLLRKFSERYGTRFRAVRQANAGVGAARNRGIDEACGRYVALLDHDDLWMPQKLEAQVAFMAAHPKCAACTVPWAFMHTPQTPAFDPALAKLNGGVVIRPLDLMTDSQFLMLTSALMFDRERAAGLRYETDRYTVEDLAMQINLLDRGDFGVASDKILMLYRRHQGNFSTQLMRLYNGQRLLRRMESQGALGSRTDPARRRELQRYLAVHGRNATVSLLCAGMRLKAASLYLSEIVPQACQGRLRFLLTIPPLLLAPRRLLKRRWPGDTTH